tara:strand:+ start:162 stop:281 length:120 start_codon:yes stop_codon:yes gene_type:complete
MRLRRIPATSIIKEVQMQEDFTKEFKDIESRVGLLRRLL